MIINGNKNINQNIKNIDVSLWLLFTIITLIFLIIIGGITRLTESGYQLQSGNQFQEFFPIFRGILAKEFDKYKQIPEFFLVNSSMTLAEFKIIYFLGVVSQIFGKISRFSFSYTFYLTTHIKKNFSKKRKPFFHLFYLWEFSSIRWLVYGTKRSCRKY